MQDTTVFYRSHMEMIDKLQDDKDKLEMYEAIVHYSLNEEKPNFSNPYLEALWTGILPTIDNTIKRHQIAVQNGMKGKEYGMKGKEYGKKGGRPRKQPVATINPETKEVTLTKENKKKDKEDMNLGTLQECEGMRTPACIPPVHYPRYESQSETAISVKDITQEPWYKPLENYMILRPKNEMSLEEYMEHYPTMRKMFIGTYRTCTEDRLKLAFNRI